MISPTSQEWLPLVQALLHTLWGGALAAGCLSLALRLVPVRRAKLRYAVALGALLSILLMGVAAWALLDAPPPSPEAMALGPVLNSPALPIPSEPVGTPVIAQPVAARAAATLTSPTLPLRSQWPRWVAACWLAGVAVFLLRSLRETLGAERLRRRCRVLTDPAILALAEELRGCLRLRRRVRLMVSQEIGVPSVMGIFWPVILLPAAMLTGLPPEAWRALLAHELAHVRRWDYLTNLGQMLIEALLFFNPFVWWISRQIRMEREACCDQVAAIECQSPARYIHALVSVIERHRAAGGATPAPLLAVTGPAGNRHGSVLERAHRLLVPGYRPAVRLRWFSLLLVLVFSGLGLAGLWTGTRALAQSIKEPEKLVKEEPALSDRSFLTMVKVVTEDGVPVGRNSGMVYEYYASGNGSGGGGSNLDEQGAAPVWFRENCTEVAVAAVMEGYAPAFAGPLTAPVKEKMANLQLTLRKGFSASIQVLNEAGEPIPGAKLQGYYPGPPAIDNDRLTSDAHSTTDGRGIAVLNHIGAAPLNVRVKADGYQSEEVAAIRLNPAQPYRWTLKMTLPLPGLVTATATGRPIPGAKIKLAGVRGPHDETYYDPTKAPLLTTADEQGRFALTSLRPDSRYYFFVDAPGYSGVFLSGIKPGPAQLNVSLGPPLLIRGKIINARPPITYEGKVHLSFGQRFQFGKNFGGQGSQSQVYEVSDEQADFVAGPFYVTQAEPGVPAEPPAHESSVSISVRDARAFFSIEELPIEDFRFDISSEAAKSNGTARKPGKPPAKTAGPEAKPLGASSLFGTVEVSALDGLRLPPESAKIRAAWSDAVEGSGGSAVGYPDLQAPGRFYVSVPSNAAKVTVAVASEGYAAVFAGPFLPPLGEKLKNLAVQLAKGSSAQVRVVDVAGQPIAGALVKGRYPGPPEMDFSETSTDAQGAAILANVGAAPLELRVAAAGCEEEVIGNVRLNPANPYVCTLKKAQMLNGTVTVAATGQPIASAKIKLAGVRGPQPETHSDPASAPLLALTNEQGRFALTTLRADSTYFLFVEAPGYGGVLAGDVIASQGRLPVGLGPELIVRGKIINVPPEDIHGGEASLGSNQYFKIGESYHATGKQIRFKPQGGTGTFATEPLYAWPVVFQYGGKQDTKVELKDFTRDDLVLDFGR